MKIKPGGGVLGARVAGIDLGRPLSDAEFRQILRALGEHGVLCLPAQQLASDAFVRFGRMFGELEINSPIHFTSRDFPRSWCCPT